MRLEPFGGAPPAISAWRSASGSTEVILSIKSASTRKASLIIGTTIRLTTKPGALHTTIGVSSMHSASSQTAATVASLVYNQRIISTSDISGTGLKKCIPRKRDDFPSDALSVVIEIEEVFEIIIASSRTTVSICVKMWTLRSRSVAASIAILAVDSPRSQ